MPITVTPITIAELTTSVVDGTGVFDKLMQANAAHLEQEFKLGRLKGPEYATVYLGALQSTLNTALAFLLGKDKATLEAELIQAQVELAQKQIELADKQIDKAAQEILLVQAQIALAQQQADNLALEAANIPKQGAVLDAQADKLIQETANAVIEGTVLVAQECKLRAEFDYVVANTLKSASENALLVQKTVTERAQTQATGVDADSVIGRQKALYVAQTNGFTRDAENKVAKTLIDTWNVRRTTDEGTVADGTNKLYDTSIGRAVTKLLDGINA